MKITKETIIRTTVLVIALANQLLVVFGKDSLPFDEGELYAGISSVITVVTSLWAWWKNNSFTKPAIAADQLLKQMKGKDL